MITQELLYDVLIAPKKAISAKRKRMFENEGHTENVALLVSADGQYEYSLKFRKSSYFFNNFSVILIWENPGKYCEISKPFTLVRFNGPHDGNKPQGEDLHHSFHVHLLTPEDVEQGRFTKPGRCAETQKYSTFEEAVWRFIAEYAMIHSRICYTGIRQRY